MTKRRQDKPEFSVEENDWPSLIRDKKIKWVKYERGTTQLSKHIVSRDVRSSIEPNLLANENIGPDWQEFSELQLNHGIDTSFGVLIDAGFGEKTESDLISEIKTKVNEEVWSLIERRLSELGDEKDGRGKKLIVLVAHWAQLFAEPLGEIWLAAMAQHACFIEEDDFAFGYLIAQLDQKRENETHFLRGNKILVAAKSGGMARSTSLKTNRDRILAEIKRLNEKSHTLARSAELAFKNNIGTSPEANRKLWRRHSEK